MQERGSVEFAPEEALLDEYSMSSVARKAEAILASL
jgi:hypothetical protein